MQTSDDRSIRVKGVTRTFGTFTALAGVDLDIPSGQIFGFLGPNGAGKSTLVKVLTTILKPTSGSATVAGLDVSTQQQEVRARIGVALQDVGLDDLMTARELLVLQAQLFHDSSSEAHERADRLLKMVKLDDVDPKKRVGTYSGGMRRRLDLALALVHQPKVLFLDEPTTGLDPASRVDIWEEVRRLNQEEGITIFLTTQYLEEADKLADKIAIINKGKIVAQGTPTELKQAIGEEVVTLGFETPEIANAASTLLAQFGRQQISGREVLIYLSEAATKISDMVRILDQGKFAVTELRLTQPSLDDVFLKATGERLTQSDV
jgi:ABC-2 type transport system ATP-binding protein